MASGCLEISRTKCHRTMMVDVAMRINYQQVVHYNMKPLLAIDPFVSHKSHHDSAGTHSATTAISQVYSVADMSKVLLCSRDAYFMLQELCCLYS